MLDDCKRTHEIKASRISNWKNLTKNDLVNSFVENELTNPTIADSYFNAIICRYWNLIYKMYKKSRASVDVETCYGWLIDGILWALKHKKWLDPTSNVYGDPNGPDKVINRCVSSVRLGFYQNSNAHKRKCNYGQESIERMVEDMHDYALPHADPLRDLENGSWMVKDLVQTAFLKKEYLQAFIVDSIANMDTFDVVRDQDNKAHLEFSKKKLVKTLRSMDDKYREAFVYNYSLEDAEVTRAIQDCKNLSRARLHTAVKRNLLKLSKNKKLVECLC